MYYKVMILEIKEDYCLAMADDGQVLRIKKKGGMREGDRIYALSEDLYVAGAEEKTGGNVIRISRKTMNAVIAVAAAVMLCLSALIIPKVTDKTYAVVSIDSDASLQVEVDRDYKVLKAVSYGNSIPEEELNGFIECSVDEVEKKLNQRQSGKDETVLVGYALKKEESERKEGEVKSYLQDILKGQQALYLKGSKEDVKQAKKAKQSLGLYMAGKAVTEEQIEEIFPDLSKEDTVDLLKKQPELMKNEDVKKALEKEEKKAGPAARSKTENAGSKEDGDDNDYDNDDDADDDTDDDYGYKNKPKATSPASKPVNTKRPAVAPPKSDDVDDEDADADIEEDNEEEEED